MTAIPCEHCAGTGSQDLPPEYALIISSLQLAGKPCTTAVLLKMVFTPVSSLHTRLEVLRRQGIVERLRRDDTPDHIAGERDKSVSVWRLVGE